MSKAVFGIFNTLVKAPRINRSARKASPVTILRPNARGKLVVSEVVQQGRKVRSNDYETETVSRLA